MNAEKLKKSLQYFALSLPFMVLGPVLFTAGSATKNGETDKLLIGLGLAALVVAMIFLGFAVSKFGKALFDD